MIDLDNQSELLVDLLALENIANGLTKQEIELILTDDEIIKALNLEHRGKNSTTDVLSFPIQAQPFDSSDMQLPLGSIVIATSYVEKNAKALGHTPQEELSLLFIHGLLHLLGYDHETDTGQMREKEKELILQFKLPKSLIVRTQES